MLTTDGVEDPTWTEHIFVISSCIRITGEVSSKTSLSTRPSSAYPTTRTQVAFPADSFKADILIRTQVVVNLALPIFFSVLFSFVKFLIVMLALWSASSMAAHFTFCFHSVCAFISFAFIVLMFGVVSGDTHYENTPIIRNILQPKRENFQIKKI